MRTILFPFFALAMQAIAPGQESEPVVARQEDPAPLPKPEMLPADDGSRVTVLGYHEFSEIKPPTAMRIKTSKFREQMEALKALDLPVISFEEFEKWKRGEGEVPPRSVLITIDDGWKSVYLEAFPILKELGYPFALFLYTKYVDGGGRALTTAMINEMQRYGCSVQSHSVSHPFPGTIKRYARQGEEEFREFLRGEYAESKRFLEKRFGKTVSSYAYPGGYVMEEMFPIGDACGYEFCFTVKPGKIRRNMSNRTLPRYIILGNYEESFEMATSFHATGAAAPLLGYQTTPHPVSPEPGSMVETRLPELWADLSGVQNLDPSSPEMRVSGFGRVPATFDPGQGRLSWTVNRRLRQQVCEVCVTWRLLDEESSEKPMRWTFLIDREASYQPGYR